MDNPHLPLYLERRLRRSHESEAQSPNPYMFVGHYVQEVSSHVTRQLCPSYNGERETACIGPSTKNDSDRLMRLSYSTAVTPPDNVQGFPGPRTTLCTLPDILLPTRTLSALGGVATSAPHARALMLSIDHSLNAIPMGTYLDCLHAVPSMLCPRALSNNRASHHVMRSHDAARSTGTGQ